MHSRRYTELEPKLDARNTDGKGRRVTYVTRTSHIVTRTLRFGGRKLYKCLSIQMEVAN